MKKFLLPLTAALALSISGTAMAANEYTINFSTKPTNAGTSKKPIPFGGKLGFTVRDTEGKRPLALDALSIDLRGVRLNGRAFPARCTASQIEQASSDKGCPSGSLVASGFANNIAGNINDRNDTSLRCYLTLRLHNSGANKAALFVQGSPNAARPCPIEVATAIPVSIARRSTGDRISLTIPDNLKTPVATIRNSLVEMSLNIRRLTRTVKGKRVGFWNLIGQCVSNRRVTNFVFTNETNNVVRQAASARCRR